MTQITKKALWKTLNDEPLIKFDIRPLIVGQTNGKPKYNGDDVTETITDAITALKDGYAIISWKGRCGEVLIIGYKPEELTIID